MSESSGKLGEYGAVVELYNSGKVPSHVKNDLEDLFGDDYVEKYTRPVMKSADPFLSVKLEGEIFSLSGNEITVRNIRKILDKESEV